MQLTKLEAARRQLETAIELYFAYGDEVSIHTLAAAAYALIRDINEHRGGRPMTKDLPSWLGPKATSELLSYINRADNFFKHADRDPEKVLDDFDPLWTEVLLVEASGAYHLLTGERNQRLFAMTFWFVGHNPALRAQVEAAHAAFGFEKKELSSLLQLPLQDRRQFWKLATGLDLKN